MAQFIEEFNMSFGHIRAMGISTPPLKFYGNDEAIIAYTKQGFFWYPNCVGFETRGEIGGCWVIIYISDHLELEPDTERAIVIPYRVTSGHFEISGEESEVRINIESGQYQLLYQNRRLSNREIENLGVFEDEFVPEEDPDSFRPELCLLTFIPATEVIEPQILRREPGFNPPSELIVFDEPMPQH